MSEIARRFDYGNIAEPEARFFERVAEKVRGIREGVSRSAIEMGRELKEAHVRFANHGNGMFGRWVEERCGITPRHARRFIAAFETFSKDDWDNLSQSLDDSSLFLLSGPSCPEEALKEAHRLAKAGKVVTHKIAAAIVERHAKPKSEHPAGYSPHGTGKKNRKTSGDAPPKTEQPKPDPPKTENAARVQESPPAPVVIETNGRVIEEPKSAPAWNLGPGEALQSFTRIMVAARTWTEDVEEKPQTISHLDSLLAVYSGDPPKLVPRVESVPHVNGKVTPADPDPSVHEVTGETSVMVFDISPAKRGGCAEWGLPQSYVDELQAVFAGVDVLDECRKARLWCANNQTKRKTAKGMREFLRRWMEKQQNSGNRTAPQRPSRLSAVDEYIAEYGEGAA